VDIFETDSAREFRRGVREFLREQLPPSWRGVNALDEDERSDFFARWRQALQDRRFIAPTWPAEYGGGGLTAVEAAILADEFARAAAPPPRSFETQGGLELLGPILLQLGTEEQKKHFLPRIVAGQDRWAQGYSEPEAGSDLASVRTGAELDGDHWVINGEKVWTSGAHHCNWIFILCRTAPTASTTRGLSFLMVPLDQPGIEIRPIINMVGVHSFNAVVFRDATTPAEMIVGQPNEGWLVATAVLSVERTRPEVAAYFEELTRIIHLAQATGQIADPLIRQSIARCYSRMEALRLYAAKMVSDQVKGRPVGPESAIVKIMYSEYRKEALDLAMEILGPEATTPTGNRPYNFVRPDTGAQGSTASWIDAFLGVQALSIAGGSAEIQRNLISERLLGMPREPRPPAPEGVSGGT
jgi:alkylation response protein AidB-like acyl-CoA dehydrogenase